jgi:hypothetical protein
MLNQDKRFDDGITLNIEKRAAARSLNDSNYWNDRNGSNRFTASSLSETHNPRT